MKEHILFEDEYTKIIFLQDDDDDEELSPEDLLGILSENDFLRIKRNRENKHKETFYID